MSNRALGIVAVSKRPLSAGDTGSSRPCTINVRCGIRCNQGHDVKADIANS
jgi:hypothetical protein